MIYSLLSSFSFIIKVSTSPSPPIEYQWCIEKIHYRYHYTVGNYWFSRITIRYCHNLNRLRANGISNLIWMIWQKGKKITLLNKEAPCIWPWNINHQKSHRYKVNGKIHEVIEGNSLTWNRFVCQIYWGPVSLNCWINFNIVVYCEFVLISFLCVYSLGVHF